MSGPPAAGKSTSARPLADALGYPLLCMDEVKEQLADAIGPGAIAITDELGDAAVRQLLASARELLSHGISVVLEGFFQSNRYSSDFADLAKMADAVLVHLLADDSVLKYRYEMRALRNERHWIHGDTEKIGTLEAELPEHMAKRLNLNIPHIVIDTTRESMDITATAHLIRQTRKHQMQENLA